MLLASCFLFIVLMPYLHNYLLSNYVITNSKNSTIQPNKHEWIALKTAGVVHASGDTTGTHRVAGEQVLGGQISKTGNATQRHVAVAIGCIVSDHVPKIGIASLHGNETALFITPQIANVVGDGWNHLGTF